VALAGDGAWGLEPAAAQHGNRLAESWQASLFELHVDPFAAGCAPEVPATTDYQSWNCEGEQQEQEPQQAQCES
jgi:hypothetical protein